MARGFSLIELMIAMFVVTILLVVAVPSFGNLTEKSKMQRLAEELSGFLVQARSEAVMQNQDLELSFSPTGTNSTSPIIDGSWYMELKVSGASDALMYLDGKPFKNMTIYANEQWQPLTLDRVNGRVDITTDAVISFSVDAKKRLQLIVERTTGKIKLCGVSGEIYGYAAC